MSFDIAVEGQPFITDLDSLSGAISAFLQLCFVAHLEYPQVTDKECVGFVTFWYGSVLLTNGCGCRVQLSPVEIFFFNFGGVAELGGGGGARGPPLCVKMSFKKCTRPEPNSLIMFMD